MHYTDEDVFVYQLMHYLVCECNYKIVNVPGGKKDVWLANDKSELYPMIRLSSVQSTSLMFEKEYINKIKKALSIVIRVEKPLLMINTHKESAAFKEDDITQVVVGEYFVSDASLNIHFPKLSEKVHKVSDNQGECARLVRSMENYQRKKIKESNKLTFKNSPKVSILISALSIIAFCIISLIASGSSGENWLADVVIGGGYYKAMVVYGKEYWRLLTTTFIHYDVFSLLFFVVAIFNIGKELEKHYSIWQYALIFFVSALVGNTCVMLFVENNISIGMAGGLFGTLGAFIVYAWETKMFMNPYARIKVSRIMMLGIASLFFSNADTLAFLGGMCSGVFLAIIFSKHPFFKDLKRHFMICFVACLACLAYGISTTTTAFPEYDEINEAIVEEYERIGLAQYANYVDNYFKGAYEE